MYEQFGPEWLSPLTASALFGLIVGLIFGVCACATQFCLRKSLIGENAVERREASAVWLLALTVAVLGTQILVLSGWLEFSEHRFHAPELPVALLVIGGMLFGAGMVLCRGCASRMVVLAGCGNTRAIIVVLIFALAAHATLKGVLAPVRTTLATMNWDIEFLLNLLQNRVMIAAVIGLLIFATAIAYRRSALSPGYIAGAALIGLLVPFGWLGNGVLLQDDFDPIPFQSLSFTSPAADTLFWGIASTSIGAGFGVGLLGGAFVGSLGLALMIGRFRWESFSSAGQTGRYSLGAVCMGVGGVFAGGCTVGAGLSGVATLSIGAALALGCIIIGALATDRVLRYADRPGTRLKTEGA